MHGACSYDNVRGGLACRGGRPVCAPAGLGHTNPCVCLACMHAAGCSDDAPAPIGRAGAATDPQSPAFGSPEAGHPADAGDQRAADPGVPRRRVGIVVVVVVVVVVRRGRNGRVGTRRRSSSCCRRRSRRRQRRRWWAQTEWGTARRQTHREATGGGTRSWWWRRWWWWY